MAENTSMDPERSVTEWIRDVQAGVEGSSHDELAARFLHRLVVLARHKLGALRAYEDEEDVAISALKTFFRRAPEGDFPHLTDRDSLWSLLAAITLHKAVSLQRRQLAGKRDVRRFQSLEALLESAPTTDFLDSVIEEGNSLLDALGDDSLREVARLRMEGYSNQEIAEKIDRSVKSVERKFALIRKCLQKRWESCREEE